MDFDETNKRLYGIARRCQSTFGLSYQHLPDLKQSAWMFFLEHGELSKVWAPLRRQVIKQLFGFVPHQSRITGVPRLAFQTIAELKPEIREFIS